MKYIIHKNAFSIYPTEIKSNDKENIKRHLDLIKQNSNSPIEIILDQERRRIWCSR